ncbi:MAG: hypothetical protein R2879_18740 [Saprospiraceae bacterium]
MIPVGQIEASQYQGRCEIIHELVVSQIDVQKIDAKLRADQLTLTLENTEQKEWLQNEIANLISLKSIEPVQILESSHSVDIISYNEGKNKIIPFFSQMLNVKELPENILFIGDRGLWPGNDFALLNNSFSLSVDKVSLSKNKCWNIASPGKKNTEALLEYLNSINFGDNGFHIKI